MKYETKIVLAFCAWTVAMIAMGLWGLSDAHGSTCSGPTHCALMGFAPHVSDVEEPPTERAERMSVKSTAIDSATEDRTERAWLIMTGWRESRWASYVYRDDPRCRNGVGGRCDAGQAWSPWQLHDTDRTGGVEVATTIALDRLRKSGRFCASRGHDYWTGGTSLYATGKTCEWKEATSRVAEMRRIEGRLR